MYNRNFLMLGLAADVSISVPQSNHKFQNKYCCTCLHIISINDEAAIDQGTYKQQLCSRAWF